MKVSQGFEMVTEEFCTSNPRDTYARPKSEYAKPWNKNRGNDCPEFEAEV